MAKGPRMWWRSRTRAGSRAPLIGAREKKSTGAPHSYSFHFNIPGKRQEIPESSRNTYFNTKKCISLGVFDQLCPQSTKVLQDASNVGAEHMVQETSNASKISVQFPQAPLVTGWFRVSNESLCWTETEWLCFMQLQLWELKISHCNSCPVICHIFQLFSNKSNKFCACPIPAAPSQLRFECRWHNKPLAHFHI